MKVLGRWSLASLMKLVIDVPYYGFLAAIPLVCVLALWIALTPAGPGQPGRRVDLEIPVRFQLDPASHPFSTTRPDVQAVSITKAQGTLEVKGASAFGAGWAALGFAIITVATALFVLGRLRAVFRTLKDQNPFVPRNSARIRMIGLALILGQLASAAFAAWLAGQVTRDISVAGVLFDNVPSFNGWVLFSGLILVMLAEVFRLGAEMKGDLETARKIQFDLVPGEVFLKDDVVVHARMRPARTVGGDLYDVVDLNDGRLAVIVGDVTGKGLPAALLMTSFLGSVRALLSAGLRGSELIAALNRHVCTNSSGGRFVTLFYGELDAATGSLTYVNAGHNPPFLLRADGAVERLEPTAMVLGVAADAAVEARQTRIGPADRLLLFTDGLSEAFDRKDEEYGEERVRDSLLRAHTLPPPAAVERLVADVERFCGSVPLRDDMTLMLVARQAAAAIP
jgi:hypothetical protein